jgi:hypothetical protein
MELRQSIHYPFEYFSAPFAFASRISDVTGAPLWECVAKYTALHEEVTGVLFQAEPNEAVWNKLVCSTAGRSWQEIAGLAYSLYLEQPYAIFDANWAPKGSTRFGALDKVSEGPI